MKKQNIFKTLNDKAFLLLLSITVMLSLSAALQADVLWSKDFAASVQKADKANSLILVQMYTDT